MQITFLGASHGVPEPNRQCTALLLETAGRFYIVDMGCMVVPELVDRGISMDDVKAVFISHMHGDHTNGLIQFVDLVSWYYKTPEPVILLPELDVVPVMGEWLRCNGVQMKQLPFERVLPGVIFDDGCLKVTAIPTEHHVPSYAFLLEAEGKRILFTGDLKHPAVDFPKVEGHIDLAVCEGAHFHVTEYAPALKEMDIGKICITHYTKHNAVRTLLLAQSMAPVPVVLANDGMEIRL